jgi:hypothetical protein
MPPRFGKFQFGLAPQIPSSSLVLRIARHSIEETGAGEQLFWQAYPRFLALSPRMERFTPSF